MVICSFCPLKSCLCHGRFFLQQVDIFFFKGDPGAIAYAVDLFVFGVEIGDFYHGVVHHDVMVLAGTHEAGYDHLAGKLTLIGQNGRFRPECQSTSLALLQGGGAHIPGSLFQAGGDTTGGMETTWNSLEVNLVRILA